MKTTSVRLALAAVVATAGSGRAGPVQPKWVEWMNRVVPRLSKLPAPPPAPGDWVTVHTPDTLPLRLGPGYRPRNKYGCWETGVNHWPGPGWRDVCVHWESDRMDPGGFHLHPEPLDPRMSDQHQSEGWKAETFSVGGRRIVVERALVSGGMEGARRQRRIVAHIELGGDELAILSGRTGDDAGYEELLTIATTVGLPHLATEAEVVARAEAYVRVNGYVDPADADPKSLIDSPPPGTTREAFLARRGHDLLPRACGVVQNVRDGFAWGWHVVFCYDPRKLTSSQQANRVVQIDLIGKDAFIPDPTPGNTSMATAGIKRLPGMDDFERLLGASGPAAGRSEPDPASFRDWTDRSPEAVDWKGGCCSVVAEWHVSLENGHLNVSPTSPDSDGKLPFEVKPLPKPGETDLAGRRHVLPVDGGFLVGFDAGEFGGGPWWFAPDGVRHRKLTLRTSDSLKDWVAENVHAFVRLGSDVIAFEGLTHLGSNSGRAVRLRRGADGEWHASLFAELKACPHAVVEESTSSWLLATTSGVWRFDGKGRQQPVWQPPGGHLYYPNSIVRDGSGVVYMGMRNMVVKMTPVSAGAYSVRVLIPPTH
jgi:hypothetical protein